MDDNSLAAPRIAAVAPKSPPLAFQVTSNDSLWAPIQGEELEDPQEKDVIRKQADALRSQHEAFTVERECWDLERDRLLRRITALETLLKAATGHSPSQSPQISPNNGSMPMSSQRRSSSNSAGRLPSIAEDESPKSRPSRPSMSSRRESAPTHIDLPQISAISFVDGHSDQISAVSNEPSEDPITPPVTRNTMSPPPAAYRQDAGHTPLKMPFRPHLLDSSPRSTASEPAPDTPTRNNTEMNASLGGDDDDENGDKSLTGPLNMPELPNTPGENSFTMDMLTARLQQIEEHPEENEPLAFRARCNRGASVSTVDDPKEIVQPSEQKKTPEQVTKTAPPSRAATSNVLSPKTSQTMAGPEEPFGGIKLKKKASSNFGAPFGQLGPLDMSHRKM